MVHPRKISFAESRGTSRFLNIRKILIFDFGHFKKFLFTGAIFERIFPPRGEPYDFDNSCFPYTFGPTFMPPICFGGYSSSNSNQFLPYCEVRDIRLCGHQTSHKIITNKTKEDFSPETRPWPIGKKKLLRWLKKEP